jgi:two-component system, LytTR family, response regulator AlgR
MKVLIVDDEAPARDRLTRLCAEITDVQVLGEAHDGVTAVEMAQRLNVDVILLDIRMPAMDGIEVARHLAAMPEPPAVIFVTAFDQYALEAFDAHAVGYLLKPIRREKLQDALQSAQRLTRPQLGELAGKSQLAGPRKQIAVRVRDRIKLIPVPEILYFLADQKYVTVKHQHGEDLIEEALKGLEDEFATEFVRVHRNALVALRAIDSVHRTQDGQLEVMIKNSPEKLDVSRRLAAELLRKLRG